MGGGREVQAGVLRGKGQAEGERLSILPKHPPMWHAASPGFVQEHTEMQAP